METETKTKKEPTRQFLVRLPVSTVQRIEEIRWQTRSPSMSAVIRTALAEWTERKMSRR